MTIGPRRTKGGSKNLITGVHRDGNGGYFTGAVNTPACTVGIIILVMLQNRPQIQSAANLFGQLTQMIGKMAAGRALDYADGLAAAGQCPLGFSAFCQKIVVIPAEALGKLVGQLLGFPDGAYLRHNQSIAAANSGSGNLGSLGIAVPG